MKKVADSIYRYSVLFFFIPIVVFLLFINIISRTYITYNEEIFLVQKSPIKSLFFAVFFILVAVGWTRMPVRKKIISALNDNKKLFIAIWSVLSALILTVCLFWVFSTKIAPFADAAWLHECAQDMRNGITEQFETGYYNYMDMYPFQCRTLLMFYLIDGVFGGYEVMVYQVLNCIAIVVIYNMLALFVLRLKGNRLQALLTLCMGLLWLPMIIYTSFIYGNILCIAFSLAAAYLWTGFVEEGKIIYGGLASVLISIALCFKSQAMIFFVAMLIYATIKFFIVKQYKKFLMFISMGICMAFAVLAPYRIIVAITGCSLDQGMATESWLNMGISYNPVGAPGWDSDDAKRDYAAAGFDLEGHREISNGKIRENTALLLSDKEYAHTFFIKKTASQFNEPSFQSIWLVREGQKITTPFFEKIVTFRGTLKLLPLLDIELMLFLLGAFLFILFSRYTDMNPVQLLLPMTAVGLFLFHFVWEAKAQYSLFFVILLIPLAIIGFAGFGEWLWRKIKEKEKFDIKSKVFTVVMVALSVLMVIGIGIGGYTQSITGDNVGLAEYIEENF